MNTLRWAIIYAGLALAVLSFAVMLGGCVPGGLLTMDDRYCAEHPHAPPSKCQR